MLVEYYSDDANCIYFRTIATHTGLEERVVRVAVRALARKGLAQFVRGLFDMDSLDGKVAGSGYCATTTGVAFIKASSDA